MRLPSDRRRDGPADPDDQLSQGLSARRLLRAGRLEEAGELLARVSEALETACSWSPLALETKTLRGAIPDCPAMLLDCLAQVSRAKGGDPIPAFEAASRAPDRQQVTLDALAATLDGSLSGTDFGRVVASVIRIGRRELAELVLQQEHGGRPLTARLGLAWLARHFGLSSGSLCEDPSAGVRGFARLQAPVDFPSPYSPAELPGLDEVQPSRLFGGHGGDWDFGAFLSLEMRLEFRFLILDYNGLDGLREELSSHATERSLPGPDRLAFGVGYGFAWTEEERPVEESIGEMLALLNAWGTFPGRLQYCGRRPFDILRDDEQLQRRYRHDLQVHPARSPKFKFWKSPAMELLARIGPGGQNPAPDCDDLLLRARESYVSPAARALESFAEGSSRERSGLPVNPFLRA